MAGTVPARSWPPAEVSSPARVPAGLHPQLVQEQGWDPGIPPGAQTGGVRARNSKAEFIFLCVFQLHLRGFVFSLEKQLYLACIYLLPLLVMGKAVPPEPGCVLLLFLLCRG